MFIFQFKFSARRHVFSVIFNVTSWFKISIWRIEYHSSYVRNLSSCENKAWKTVLGFYEIRNRDLCANGAALNLLELNDHFSLGPQET